MIYLDSAATTLQKPPAVARASAEAVNTLSSPGRGSYPAAMAAAETAFACREEAAALFNVPDPENVVFTFNATHGLNIAIKTLARPGSRVLLSGYEHNAVTRTLCAIPDLDLRIARAPLFDRDAMVEAFRRELGSGVDVVVCNHVSNVFGAVLPVEEVSALCRRYGVPLIVDASQSAGILPVDLQALDAAFVAMPGHKGLYGPQGTGLLLCGQLSAQPLLEGGTGSHSILQSMPEFLPDRLEAGTHNITGIAGLLEGLRFVRRIGVDAIYAHENLLIHRLRDNLTAYPEVQMFWTDEPGAQTGVLSFRVDRLDCEEVGGRLGALGFAVRAGLHCAPLAHETAGTLDTGTVRVSLSAFNTENEIRQFTKAMERILL